MSERYNVRDTEARWQKVFAAQKGGFPVLSIDGFMPAQDDSFRDIVENYGMDAARLLLLSKHKSAWQKNQFDGGELEGAWKYLHRLWRLARTADFNRAGDDASSAKMTRVTHQTIRDVSHSLQNDRADKAIAHIRAYSNALENFTGAGAVLKQGLEVLCQLITPFTPHIAEEIWAHLGHSDLVARTPWPKADPAILQDNIVTMAVQVNGKLRATIRVEKDTAPKNTGQIALADKNVQKALQGKRTQKIIVVPNRIINVVV